MVSDTMMFSTGSKRSSCHKKRTSEAKKKTNVALCKECTKSATLLNTTRSTKRRTIAFNLITITEMPTPTYVFQGNHPPKSMTKLIFKKRLRFLLISLKTLIESTIQLLEIIKLGLKCKKNNNTRDENCTHNFLLNFLKSVTASGLGRSILSLSPPP